MSRYSRKKSPVTEPMLLAMKRMASGEQLVLQHNRTHPRLGGEVLGLAAFNGLRARELIAGRYGPFETVYRLTPLGEEKVKEWTTVTGQ